jgi:lysophospholipase L1-like esterase
MSFNIKAFYLCLALSMASPAFAEIALPVHVSGRVRIDSIKPQSAQSYQWPAVAFHARFKGPDVTLKINDNSNALILYIDDLKKLELTKPGKLTLKLSGLGQGVHTVKLAKKNEAQGLNPAFLEFNATHGTFYGFYVPTKAQVMPAPSFKRQIEFIGDSYTVGYGNEATKKDCNGPDIFEMTDSNQAFGVLTAKSQNADYQINAASGFGVVRNYANRLSGTTLPIIYSRAIFDDPKTIYKNPKWKPNVIVIGLGTNDFSTPLGATDRWKTREGLQADYVATYIQFVKTLRTLNSNAHFILMAPDNVQGETQTQVKKVFEALKASGETRIGFIPMNGLDFNGCHTHLSIIDNQKVHSLLDAYFLENQHIWDRK